MRQGGTPTALTCSTPTPTQAPANGKPCSAGAIPEMEIIMPIITDIGITFTVKPDELQSIRFALSYLIANCQDAIEAYGEGFPDTEDGLCALHDKIQELCAQ